MKKTLKQIILFIILGISSSVIADKEILYSDKNITIYTDNTITYTGKKTVPVFKLSSKKTTLLSKKNIVKWILNTLTSLRKA